MSNLKVQGNPSGTGSVTLQAPNTNSDYTLTLPTATAPIGTFSVGEVKMGLTPPSGGTWLEAGKYYSKATYPALAAAVGDVADIGAGNVTTPQAFAEYAFFAGPSTNTTDYYTTATNGTVTVMAGNGGRLSYTTDGLTWRGTPSQTTQTFREVRFLNGLFIAVANNGVICVSPDGINWQARNAGIAVALLSVTYGNGVWLAAGPAAYCVSSDGYNWTAYNNPTSLLTRVTFGQGVFIALNGDIIRSSTDGITWTLRLSGPGTFNDVIFIPNWNGSPTFVACGSSIHTSNDGITWTSRVTSVTLGQATFGNNKVVITQTATNGVYTGSNVSTWNARTWDSTIQASGATGVAWTGTSFFTAGSNAGAEIGRWCSSTDGDTWTANVDSNCSVFRSVGVTHNGYGIGWGTSGASVLLIGTTKRIIGSASTGWNIGYSGPTGAVAARTVAYDGSTYYVAGINGGIILRATNPTNWDTAFAVTGTSINFVAARYLNGNFIVVGTGGRIARSSDAVTWNVYTAGSNELNGAAYGAGVYVVVGVNGSCYSSPDGITWTSRSAGATTFTDIIFANGRFVATTTTTTLYYSNDGITWTSVSLLSAMFRVIYTNSNFVAVGAAGRAMVSADGITWATYNTPAFNTLTDIAASGTTVVAVGAGTGISISTAPFTSWSSPSTGVTGSNLNLRSIGVTGAGRWVAYAQNNVALTSTDPINTWTRISTAGINNFSGIPSFEFINNRFIVLSSAFAQTSTDGLSWTRADQILPTNANTARSYKFGSRYFVLSANGVHTSGDGITFTWVRTLPFRTFTAIAYSGTKYLAMAAADGGAATGIWESSDGATWTKASEFGDLATTTSLSFPVDLVYANGNFVLATGGQVTTQNIFYMIYTSANGVTWTGRTTPFVTTTVNTTLATDGTNIIYSTGTSGVYRSTDGGVTWTVLTYPVNINVTNAAYIGNNWWTVGPYWSKDLVNWVFRGGGSNTTPSGFVTVNDQCIYWNSGVRYVVSLSESTSFVMQGFVNTPFNFPANQNKELPVRGNTIVAGVSAMNSNVTPNLLVEVPLYSYDTSTTFYLPPIAAQVGGKAYVYAGA